MAKNNKKKVRFFAAGEKLGWRKEDSQTKRRRIALRNRGGKLLSAGRALRYLANVTRDPGTKRKAEADAQYFFAKYRKRKNGSRKR